MEKLIHNFLEIWPLTNLKNLKTGDSVNLEADALIKYVEKLLLFNKNKAENTSRDEITSVWLEENGW